MTSRLHFATIRFRSFGPVKLPVIRKGQSPPRVNGCCWSMGLCDSVRGEGETGEANAKVCKCGRREQNHDRKIDGRDAGGPCARCNQRGRPCSGSRDEAWKCTFQEGVEGREKRRQGEKRSRR
jgi:hypothetical protein